MRRHVGLLWVVACACAPAPSPAERDAKHADEPEVPVEPETQPRTPQARCDARLDNLPPRAPVVVAPASGSINADPEGLTVGMSPFGDDDGGAHAATEVEIWRLRDGAMDQRVWHVRTAAPRTRLFLDEGAFEREAMDDGRLKAGKDYAARARVSDDSEACNTWSAWSALARFRTDDGSRALFESDVVRVFDVTLPPESVAGINAEAASPGCFQYPRTPYPGSISVDGEVFDGVGVRIKGGCGSSRNLDQKASLKISLSWDDPALPGCPEERRFHGQKTLTFNNGVQDHSAEHEALGYRLYRAAGVPAPRVAHAWLRVNGADMGLYQLVETIDRRFLSRFYQDNGGMMYEGAYWCDLTADRMPPAVEEPASCFQREFTTDACDTPAAGDDATDWTLLQGFTQSLDTLQGLGPGGFYPAIRDVMDFDGFLSMWAVDATLAHWDGYTFTIINNYRVYHDTQTGLFSMFPWGIDQTFAGDVDPWFSDARIVQMCADDPACDAAFAQRLGEIATLMEQLDLATAADALHARIAPFVAADPRKEYGTAEWEDLHIQLKAWIAQRPQQMRQKLTDRGF